MEDIFESSVLLALEMIDFVAIIALFFLYAIAEWQILKKAGEKGWKSLIPFYNLYISHHIVGMSHVWFIIEVIIWVIEIVFEIVKLPHPVVFWFGVAVAIFTIISELIHVIKMCNCFGKGTAFKVGMALIPEVFLMIIAFGKSKYQKPEHKNRAA